MAAKSITLHPDAPAAAMAMDLGYRLTAAINIVGFELESWRWLVDWCDNIRSSIRELIDVTAPNSMKDARAQFVSKPVLDVFSEINQSSWLYDHQADDYTDEAVLKKIFHGIWNINKTIFRAVEASPDRKQGRCGLLGFWLLGERIALNDLNAFRPFQEKSHESFSISMTQKRPPKFAELNMTDDPVWESVPLLGKGFIDYIQRKERPLYSAPMFTQGGCVRFLKALFHPSLFRSTLWAHPDSDHEGWLVWVAGKHFSTPGVVCLPGKRGQWRKQRLATLILAMLINKADGLPPGECGWISRDSLSGTPERSAASKLWELLCNTAMPIGELEYVSKRNPKGVPHRGLCRLPEGCAHDDCDLVVEGDTGKIWMPPEFPVKTTFAK